MDFKLPDLGEGIAEGEVVKWLVNEGDVIKEDQPMVEVMTDKATVEIPAPSKGKIERINFKAGDIVEVGQVLVVIAVEGETKPSAAKKSIHPEARDLSHPPIKSGAGSEGRTHACGRPEGSQAFSGAVLATPAVRKLAKDLGVDLSTLKASGPGGRVTQEDVAKAKGGSRTESGASPGHPARFTAHAVQKFGAEERIPLRGIRKTIAHKLQMSKHYAPHFTYVEEVDMTEIVNLKKKTGHSYLSYVVKALIPALKEFPYLNASLDETTEEIVLKKHYNIGIAVDTKEGLIVPVVKEVDKKSLKEIEDEVKRLATATRENKAKPDELKGASFTVTSIGSIGGVFATPIINYPDVAILGVNKIVERPVVKQGKIVPRHMIYLSLSLDHRVVDGAVGARFMNKLVEQLENPGSIC